MVLRPIFPPVERNFSPQEQQAAGDILDAQTLELLAVDRARLLQDTAAGMLLLGKRVGLSEEVAQEIAEAFLRKSQDLSPSYHAFINSLVSAMVEVYSVEEPVKTVQIEMAQQSTADASGDNLSDIPDYAGPVLEFSPEDRLFRHNQRTFGPMRKFLRGVIPSEMFDTDLLTAEEASLLTWQVLDFYKRYKMPNATADRKTKQIERVAKHVGLYGQPVTIKEMGEVPGEAGSASIAATLKTAKRNIAAIIGPNPVNMLSRARKTLRVASFDTLFVPETEALRAVATENLETEDWHNGGSVDEFLGETGFSSAYTGDS